MCALFAVTGVSNVICQATPASLSTAFEYICVISLVACGPCICTASEIDVLVIPTAGIARRRIDTDVEGRFCGGLCGQSRGTTGTLLSISGPARDRSRGGSYRVAAVLRLERRCLTIITNCHIEPPLCISPSRMGYSMMSNVDW